MKLNFTKGKLRYFTESLKNNFFSTPSLFPTNVQHFINNSMLHNVMYYICSQPKGLQRKDLERLFKLLRKGLFH